MYFFFYKDSSGDIHKIEFEINEYNSVMELIWDRGYEDWGDCRGRAWCGTCQVMTDTIPAKEKLDLDERICLNQLDNTTSFSRLSCQILLNKNIHGKQFKFLGDE